ncbi:CCA tRNA nucleotidyltransferase [Synechococcus sp. WH 8020]|uniref:CCA tRNA nucleotidyltransferase n=1 Tax=Synechococcus sp. (strain WH8020) TaxID=32052 RepID=UPI000ABBEDCD|nr:CCA tRNA nucleotidyltransferase [Synechococcus sp. WH 8020]
MERPGLPPQLLPALQALASEAGASRLALVGGAVRDALLHDQHRNPWRDLPDLDLVLEGSASELAAALQRHFGDQRVQEVRVHAAYGTAELSFDGVLLDLAGARQEQYPAPGENPVVTSGSLERDLERRDFTVNAMALELSLSGDREPWLLDPHGGQSHLARRELAFLHASSVADDPTRVIRAARYGARLGFVLAPCALDQLRTTVKRWPWAWRHGQSTEHVPPALGTRLRMELELLFENEPWLKALGLLQEWGALVLLDPLLASNAELIRRLRWASRLRIPLLLALVAASADPVSLALRLQIPLGQQRCLEESISLKHWVHSEVLPQAWVGWSAAQWTEALETRAWSAEAVVLTVAMGVPCWRPMLRWWGRWRKVASPLSAKDLIASGILPGPELGLVLRQERLKMLETMK